jgi:hypothetical protein
VVVVSFSSIMVWFPFGVGRHCPARYSHTVAYDATP